eukprot:584827-Rhodomonas_salina.1
MAWCFAIQSQPQAALGALDRSSEIKHEKPHSWYKLYGKHALFDLIPRGRLTWALVGPNRHLNGLQPFPLFDHEEMRPCAHGIHHVMSALGPTITAFVCA